MANNLGGTVTKFTSRLDTILETQTKTADLNLNGELLGEFAGVGEIKIAFDCQSECRCSNPLSRTLPSIIYNDDALDAVEATLGSRMALLDGLGELVTLGELNEVGGVLYSNTSYAAPRWGTDPAPLHGAGTPKHTRNTTAPTMRTARPSAMDLRRYCRGRPANTATWPTIARRSPCTAHARPTPGTPWRSARPSATACNLASPSTIRYTLWSRLGGCMDGNSYSPGVVAAALVIILLVIFLGPFLIIPALCLAPLVCAIFALAGKS